MKETEENIKVTENGRMNENADSGGSGRLKVHKIENFFDSDFGICVISLLVMHK